MCVVPNHIFTIGAIKVLLDFVFIDIFFRWLPPFSDEQINNLGNFLMCANHVFFSYFYAKLCELYKLFKHHKLWQKNLIFLLLTILILPFAMFDFKNFKVFDNFFIDNNSITIYFTMICTILAFYLNLFFEFLTKKFPIPFEKIGYFFSIELCKDLFKRKKKS